MLTAIHSHLGDLVNIVQYHRMIDDEICIKPCQCGHPTCSKDKMPMLEYLLSLVEHRLKPNPEFSIGTYAIPTWIRTPHFDPYWRFDPFVKAIGVPESQTGTTICQFDARSTSNKLVSDEMISYVSSRFPGAINVGDRRYDGFDNRWQLDLREKFDLLKQAKYYVGVESGMSCLALMTNVERCLILHPQAYPAWDNHPLSRQARYVSSPQQLEAALHETPAMVVPCIQEAIRLFNKRRGQIVWDVTRRYIMQLISYVPSVISTSPDDNYLGNVFVQDQGTLLTKFNRRIDLLILEGDSHLSVYEEARRFLSVKSLLVVEQARTSPELIARISKDGFRPAFIGEQALFVIPFRAVVRYKRLNQM